MGGSRSPSAIWEALGHQETRHDPRSKSHTSVIIPGKTLTSIIQFNMLTAVKNFAFWTILISFIAFEIWSHPTECGWIAKTITSGASEQTSKPETTPSSTAPAVSVPPKLVASELPKPKPSATVARFVPAPTPVIVGTRVRTAVAAAKSSQSMSLQLNSAFSLSQLEAAKAKALAQHKPLGFIMVWGEFFGKEENTRLRGGVPGLCHFYRAFNSELVLVYVRHETELGLVPEAVKRGFFGPDEGGFAPNMAVVDATASEFIVEIPYGGNDSNGEKRDKVFGAGAEKIDLWLATHPLATATPSPTP